jgi:hypothetical protein
MNRHLLSSASGDGGYVLYRRHSQGIPSSSTASSASRPAVAIAISAPLAENQIVMLADRCF